MSNTVSQHGADSAAAAGFPTAFDSALQLQLWLAAQLLGLPDSALAGLGLERQSFERELAPHMREVENYRKLQATARLMTRAATAELLRCRVNCMALAARTPAELAAVARTVKTLPDWVWEDALVGDGERHTAQGAGLKAQGSGAGRQDMAAYLTGLDEQLAQPLLNRQQRRAQEAVQRKG